MRSSAAVSAPPPRWNHNTHYHPLILGAVPDGCRRSLDVGCGEGMLARELRRVVPHVTAIDRDAASIDVARRRNPGNRYPADLPFALAGAVGHRVHTVSKPCWEDAAPRVWPAPATFAEARRLAERVLPGVRYRRRLLFRYSLVWTKPA